MRPMTEEREIGPATRTGGATLPSSFTDGCHRRGEEALGAKEEKTDRDGNEVLPPLHQLGPRWGWKGKGGAIRSKCSKYLQGDPYGRGKDYVDIKFKVPSQAWVADQPYS